MQQSSYMTERTTVLRASMLVLHFMFVFLLFIPKIFSLLLSKVEQRWLEAPWASSLLNIGLLIDTLIHAVLELVQHHNTSTVVIHLDTLISDTIRANQFTYLRCYAGLLYSIITSNSNNSTLVDVLATRHIILVWSHKEDNQTYQYSNIVDSSLPQWW